MTSRVPFTVPCTVRVSLAMIVRLTLALIALQAAFVVATDPIAPHLLIVVESGAEAVVSLKGYDLDGDTLVASVDTISLGNGKLYQLSKVYSSYGYEPKQGASLTGGTVVTGSKNRVYYRRPSTDVAPVGAWGGLTYTVSDSTSTSLPGMVTPKSSRPSDLFDSEEMPPFTAPLGPIPGIIIHTYLAHRSLWCLPRAFSSEVTSREARRAGQ